MEKFRLMGKPIDLSSYHIAQDAEYQQSLIEKLKEEMQEFNQTPNEEEAADMLEVIFALFHTFKLDRTRVEEIRQQKLAERGGFEKRVILEKVSDENID